MCVVEKSNKDTLFTSAERIELAKKSLNGVENVDVVGFNGLLVDYAKNTKCKCDIKRSSCSI